MLPSLLVVVECSPASCLGCSFPRLSVLCPLVTSESASPPTLNICLRTRRSDGLGFSNLLDPAGPSCARSISFPSTSCDVGLLTLSFLFEPLPPLPKKRQTRQTRAHFFSCGATSGAV